MSADLERLVEQEQIGQQGPDVDRGIEIIDDLRPDGALRQHESHRLAGARGILADQLDEGRLVVAGGAGGGAMAAMIARPASARAR